MSHLVMAVALGGTVARNPLGKTLGLQPIGWSEDAADDDWVGDRTGDECAIHWNDDVVVALPDGAVVLARSPDGEVQVARFGPRAWGIQAHPEADLDVVRHWLESDRDDHVSLGIDQGAVLAEIVASADELEKHWRPMARRFAEMAGIAPVAAR